VELVVVETAGDLDRTRAFADIGAFGVFVREIEHCLVQRTVDLAVHSYKDLPTRERPPELVVAAVPERRDAADVLLARPGAVDPAGDDLLGLVLGARVGTSSARRRAQLASLRPDLVAVPLRGNVPTRVRKVREGACDAALLAAAGLARLAGAEDAPDLAGLVVRRLPPDRFVPAPAQGALAVQVRADRADVVQAVREIDDPSVARALDAERALLRLVEGGCDLPFGAWAEAAADGSLRLVAGLEVDGAFRRASRRGRDPEELAAQTLAVLTGAAVLPERAT
jgi:hydroxymethylbilane synthase